MVAVVNLIGGATTYVPFEAVALDRTQGGRCAPRFELLPKPRHHG
jgi:hypothetical protein